MFKPKIDDSGGFCLCGCGTPTTQWTRNDINRGRVKGAYKKYIFGHKLPPSFKGKTRSLSDRTKKSVSAKKRVLDGKHNFYKGGVSNVALAQRNSFEYKEWRKNVFMRDRWACVMCGAKSGWNKELGKRIVIEADHIKPKSAYPELITQVSNGRTLCHDCHLGTDTYGGRTTIKNYLKRIYDKQIYAKGIKN